MNKLQMAQEYALKMLENLNPMQIDKPTRDGIVYECFELAEAMLAENDKRVVKLPDVFFDTKQNEEWQPDWSQAPDWANWWAMDENKNTRWIYSQLEQPYISDIFLRWCAVGMFDSADAPSFGYTGDWRNSLRKRPQ